MKDSTEFHKIADALLQSLADSIENNDKNSDVEYLQGVLNIELGDGRKYVLNKHEPSRQIWLSSPVSGAHKFRHDENKWIGHEGEDLFSILTAEIGL